MTDNKETRFTQTRRIDALVFIDGVEVPFTWLEVSFVADQPSTAAISVEPDALTDRWRPRSLVHIFVRLPFSDDLPAEDKSVAGRARDVDFDKKSFALYWEGELTSIADEEGAERRQTVIRCMDAWLIPQTAQLSMVQAGADLSVPLVNGSTFVPAALGDDGSLSEIIINGLIAFLFRQPQGDSVTPVKETTEPPKGLADLAVLLLEFLAPYNAAYGLQVARSQLVAKLTGINDATLGKFVTQIMAEEIIRGAAPQYDASTVWGLLISTLSKFFYHTVTLPFPLPGDKQYRSLAVVPNLHYALPPFCNWLFPDQYQQRTIGREFMDEPTRLGIKTSLAEATGDVIHMAPHALVSEILASLGAGTTPADVFGSQGSALPTDKELSERFAAIGFFAANADGTPNTTRNLLKYLSAEEIEKGIIYQQDQNDYQAILARAAVAAKTDTSSADSIEQQGTTYAGQVNTAGSYPYYTRWLAEYQLTMRKLSRAVAVSGPFNPWPVVGLPVLLVRQGRSYRGLLTALTSRIDFTGQTQTSYQIDYGMLVRPTLLPSDVDTAAQEVGKAFSDANAALRAASDKVGVESEATDTLDEIDEQARLLSEAVNKVAASSEYSNARIDARNVLYLLGTSTGAATLRSLALYATVSADISSAVPDVDSLVESGVAADAARVFSALGLTQQDITLIGEAQLARYAGSKPLPSLLRAYHSWLSAAKRLMQSFYAAVSLDSSSGDAVAGGSSPDEAAYLASLERDRQLAARIAELDKKIAALEGAQGTAFSMRNEMIREREDLAATREELRDQPARYDWLATLDAWRRQYAADPLYPSMPVLSQLLVTSIGYATGAVTNRAYSEISKSRALSSINKVFDDLRLLYDRYLRVTAAEANAEADTSASSVRNAMLTVPLSTVIGDLGQRYVELTEVTFTDEQRQALRELDEAIAGVRQKLDAVSGMVQDNELEIPPLFPFSNTALSLVSEYDKAVAAIVQPRYPEGEYATRLDGAVSKALSTLLDITRSDRPDIQRNTVLAYDAFIRVARKVFPLADDSNNVTEYQEHKTAGDVHAWANRVQARKTVSLEDFVTRNHLTLVLHAEGSPFGVGYFYQMKSATVTGHSGGQGVGGYFSKLGSTDIAPSGSNLARSLNEVRAAAGRNEVYRRILSEEARQALVLEYARKHAVPAAYQGKK